METLDFIFKTFIALVNCFAVSFICIVVARICRKMSERINTMSEFLLLIDKRIDFLVYKNDMVYLNQLNIIKKDLIASERYEDVALVNAAIEQEQKRIYEYMEKTKKQEEQEKKQEE